MKIFNKVSIIVVLVVVCTFGLAGLIRAATAVNLGAADSFAVLAGAGITNTGPTTITGDVGTHPTLTETGFASITLNGTNHIGDAVTELAKTNLVTAYDNAAGQAPVSTVPTELGGTTKTAGIYDSADGTFGITGTLTLDAEGDSNAVFIFKTASTLITAGSSNVVLANGAQACNVFWQVGSSATLGTNSAFRGNILALTSITLTTGATVNGRVLARNGAVTLDTNTITKATCVAPSQLTVTKTVTNNNGGTKVVADFPLFIDGVSVTSGVASTTSVGLHTVSETSNSGYTATIGGDCAANGTVTLAAGETKTCTITNDDIAPQLIVTKTVINDSGSAKVIADFPLFIDGVSVTSGVASTTSVGLHTVSETSNSGYTATIGGDCAANGTVTLALGDVKTCTVVNDDIASPVVVSPSSGGGGYLPVAPLIDVVKVPNPLALPAGPGLVTYTYTLRNIGTVAVNSITMVGDTCSPIILISGDVNADTRLNEDETWIYRCSTMLTKTHTNIVTATGWAYSMSATDIANATVVVGIPIVPPLIHVTKVPSPLTLPVGGEMVTYTNKVTNPGAVPLSNVRLTDDKCGPVTYSSGDTNGNTKLDTAETWTYTCRMSLAKTTVNTVTASGEANGLTAKDFAIVTVIVAVPKLPDTGMGSDEKSTPWSIVIPAGIFAVLVFFYLVRRKQTV